MDKKNACVDNLFMVDSCMPPVGLLESLEAMTGPEPHYRKALLGEEPRIWDFQVLTDPSVVADWSAYQFEMAVQRRGVIMIVRRLSGAPRAIELALKGSLIKREYGSSASVGLLRDLPVYYPFFAKPVQFMAQISGFADVPTETLALKPMLHGRNATEQGVTLILPGPAQVILLTYS